MKFTAVLFFIAFLASNIFAQDWQKLSADDLKKIVPEKAPVIKEQIETELRTASGITDGKSKIFGVVIITAGYEADGKYTHFFKTDAKMKVGELSLDKGEYIFGYQRLNAESLRVMFYHAEDGELIGALKAKVEQKKGAIYSLLIEPPIAKKGKIYIGRFTFDYELE